MIESVLNEIFTLVIKCKTEIKIFCLAYVLVIPLLILLSCRIHEMAHAIEILLSCRKTNFQEQLKIRITIKPSRNLVRTDSNFYQFLSENRQDNTICQIIKRNAIAGTLGCICFSLVLIVIFLLPFIIFPDDFTIGYAIFCGTILAMWIAFSISGYGVNKKTDYRFADKYIYHHPENYEYTFSE